MTDRRRTAWRLVLLFALVVPLWLATSALAHYVFDDFSSYGEALWSGIRHPLDPGALADDDDAGERIVGLAQLLIGVVFILGALLAFVQDAVSGSLQRLTEGDPRVRATGTFPAG